MYNSSSVPQINNFLLCQLHPKHKYLGVFVSNKAKHIQSLMLVYSKICFTLSCLLVPFKLFTMVSRQGGILGLGANYRVLKCYVYQIFQKNFFSRKGRWPIFIMIRFICDFRDVWPFTIHHTRLDTVDTINPPIQKNYFTLTNWPFSWASVFWHIWQLWATRLIACRW